MQDGGSHVWVEPFHASGGVGEWGGGGGCTVLLYFLAFLFVHLISYRISTQTTKYTEPRMTLGTDLNVRGTDLTALSRFILKVNLLQCVSRGRYYFAFVASDTNVHVWRPRKPIYMVNTTNLTALQWKTKIFKDPIPPPVKEPAH